MSDQLAKYGDKCPLSQQVIILSAYIVVMFVTDHGKLMGNTVLGVFMKWSIVE